MCQWRLLKRSYVISHYHRKFFSVFREVVIRHVSGKVLLCYFSTLTFMLHLSSKEARIKVEQSALCGTAVLTRHLLHLNATEWI
jgi:hypothetical protein